MGRIFYVGVSIAFCVVMRLGELMVAVKGLIGERYLVGGLQGN